MSNETFVLLVGPGHAHDGTFALRISPDHADEVTASLREAGFKPDAGLEHSHGPELALFFVAFAQAGGIQQLAAVITAILSRHDNKRFVVRGPGEVEIEADGYSEVQVRRLLDTTYRNIQERDAQWQQIMDAGGLTSNHAPRAVEDSDEEGSES